MKRVLTILCTIIVSLAIIACGTINSVPANNTSTKSTTNDNVLGRVKMISGTVFQTYDRHQALVRITTSSSTLALVLVVMPDSSNEFFYDDLAINGQHIFIGTHTYKTKGDYYKTVPVYIKKKYYVEGMEWDDLLGRISTP